MNPRLEQVNAVEDPFRRLVRIMEVLLSPEGCPWDREQTHESLLPYLVEEAYEVKEDVLAGNWDDVKKELGDVALQVVFHAALGKREDRFDIDDVMQAVCDKLIRRHPHVFGDTENLTSREVLKNWEEIKKQEKIAEGKAADVRETSALDGVPETLPGLQRAQRIQEKAAHVNFDWEHIDQVWAKVEEEFAELEEAFDERNDRMFEEELGDLLFALVNLARFKKIWAELAIGKAIDKFHHRFRYIEKHVLENSLDIHSMSLVELDQLWNEAKEQSKHIEL